MTIITATIAKTMTTTNTSNKQHNNDTGFSVLTATHVRNCQKKIKKVYIGYGHPFHYGNPNKMGM